MAGYIQVNMRMNSIRRASTSTPLALVDVAAQFVGVALEADSGLADEINIDTSAPQSNVSSRIAVPIQESICARLMVVTPFSKLLTRFADGRKCLVVKGVIATVRRNCKACANRYATVHGSTPRDARRMFYRAILRREESNDVRPNIH